MLDKFRIFIKVAECGSFSKAGKTLELSPSSVSRQIDRLEASLAIKLFHRSTRHLRLTELGENLIDGVRKTVSDFDALVASVKPAKKEPEGRLRITAFESFGRLQICPLIPQFLALYPNITVDIALDNQVADLYRDDIDLAIRIGNPQDSRLKLRKLATNKMIVCASKHYLNQHGIPLYPQELTNHNCLAIKFNRQSTNWYFHRGKEKQKIQVGGNLLSSGGTPLVEAAVQDLGILMLSEWMLKDKLNSDELVPILESWQASLYEKGSGDIYMVFLDNKYMNPALRVFINFIVQRLSEPDKY